MLRGRIRWLVRSVEPGVDDERQARFRRQLRAQDGVFTVDQAHGAGYGADAIRRRVRSGEWTRAGHLVLQVATHARTPRSRVFAAVLSLGEGAVLVGPTAAWWRKLQDAPPAVLDIAVPRDAHPVPRRGVRLQRRDIAVSDRAVVDGVTVTGRALTVLDAAADLGPVEGARLMDRALQRGGTTVEALREAQATRTARPGAELLRRLIRLAAGGARSEAERLAHRRLRQDHIEGWTADVEVLLPGHGRAVLDIAFLEARVVVEIDGWAFHRDQRAFVRDEARQNALAAAGWIVLRTNWHELTSEPEKLVAALGSVLARRSSSGA